MLAGAALVTKQKVQKAKEMLGETALPPRLNAVVEGAMGRLETLFRKEVDLLMSQKVFGQDMTMKLRGMSSRMLSTSRCVAAYVFVCDAQSVTILYLQTAGRRILFWKP